MALSIHTSLEQLSDVLRPFGTKPIGTSKRTISTTHDERIDTVLDEIVSSCATTLHLPEGGTAGRADESSTEAGESSNIVPTNLYSTT